MLDVSHQVVSIPFWGSCSASPACILVPLVSYPNNPEASVGQHSVNLKTVVMHHSPQIYHRMTFLMVPSLWVGLDRVVAD